ncbi:hypothetical protein PF010_g32651, partial [Phytophthora fragariae]
KHQRALDKGLYKSTHARL